ncbi:hypothetical protein BDD12DRAFT_536821 [Trichophaea hybrida]|nr:hypothetical protein BDD12DRAFT_536821 [Trichophaea hybrida]
MKWTTLLSSFFTVSSTALAPQHPRAVKSSSVMMVAIAKLRSEEGYVVLRISARDYLSRCCVEITCYTHKDSGLCRYLSDGCEDGYFLPSKECPEYSKCCVKRRFHHKKPEEHHEEHRPKEHKHEEHKPK